MFGRVLNTLVIYCNDPPTMNIKQKNGIRFDRLRNELDVIDAAVDDIGKLLKDEIIGIFEIKYD